MVMHQYENKQYYLLDNLVLSTVQLPHAHISITEFICQSIDNNEFGCGVFIDFDTINHTILLTKLGHYGIRSVGLDWFKSYLSQREQFVNVNVITYFLYQWRMVCHKDLI